MVNAVTRLKLFIAYYKNIAYRNMFRGMLKEALLVFPPPVTPGGIFFMDISGYRALYTYISLHSAAIRC